MNRVLHVIGRKNVGKTRMVCALIAEFARRGMRVVSIKHSAHFHETDKPGSDSHAHREAGSIAAVFVTSSGMALHLPTTCADDYLATLRPMLPEHDLVLIEGGRDGPLGPVIEVWRADCGEDPIAFAGYEVQAIITDDTLPEGLDLNRWPTQAGVAADRIERLIGAD